MTGDVSPEAATAVIDALLLAVIHAHPSDTKGRDDYRRLNEAKSALFGIDGPQGRPPDNDLPELMFMAETYIAERGKPEIGDGYALQWPDGEPRNYRAAQTLARAAIQARREAEPGYAPHSSEKVRNLQQKFSRNIGEWLKMSYGQEGLAESVFDVKVRELAELLEPLGIAVEVSSASLRDVKSGN